MNKDSVTIINDFFKKNQIFINPENYLKGYLTKSNHTVELPEDIVNKIIGDAYGSANSLIKDISNQFIKQFGLYLGRVQKNQLKKYIDYRFNNDFNIFKGLISHEFEYNINLKKFIDQFIIDSEYSIKAAIDIFLSNLKDAFNQEKYKRVQDYIVFLYSRLLGLNENKLISLSELFLNNEKFIKKELQNQEYLTLKKICSSKDKKDRIKAVSEFNKAYLNILEQNSNHQEKSGVIYFNITQKLCNKFTSKMEFYDYLLCAISESYHQLQNHKTFIIHIKNILINGINIKWELYSYLTIYAEKFLSVEENRPYYKPYEIVKDILEHKYNIFLDNNEIDFLKEFYEKNKKTGTLEQVDKFRDKVIIETIKSFKKIDIGFTFIDCLILKLEDEIDNSSEISFIKNNNELLLIFAKHRIDDRKIPCPICGSLKISGNSYSEVGIRSWECKNPLCSERSKTNRGKRYSVRTILMQESTYDFSEENQIDKDLISIWRKDVVEKWAFDSLYEMIIKYYSFVNDTITIIGCDYPDKFKKITKKQKRNLLTKSYEQFLPYSKKEKVFLAFFSNSEFVSRFIYKKKKGEKYPIDSKFYHEKNCKTVKFILADCYNCLDSIPDKTIHNMVTSPPYYNAREYSQWGNLFNYLNDMYNINLCSNNALVDGGVFFYNIGDIFDNENTIIKSKMGKKRVPLGAYTIFLFKKAGFELLDNIVWYKGEPQSNRHKNDGNYTPYYQRPANCYEHIFIFKKKGKIHLNKALNKNPLKENIQKFAPVFKIGPGGENRYGHTAPFPKTIPYLSTLCFTNNGDIVLDPFSGSGTAAIVACQNNRSGIGIELNKEYFDLSVQKAQEEYLEVRKLDDEKD